uniref:Ig-like domain-containing protein n=1 Tax=Oncorhynchus mykiss TaxID=8022 RepID=A0A8C7RW62_ONCMY
MNPLAVGSNVTLNLVPQSPINIGTWSYETTTIVLFYPGGSSVSTSYRGRVLFSSSELSISSLQLNDSGRYTVQGMEPVLNAVVTLSVRGKELTSVTASDRVWLGGGNSTLTIISVTRYDEGPFRCDVINGISNGTSQPIGLNVRYGPSNLTMMVVPEMIIGHTAYKTGSDITLSCSAQSKPAVSYKWRFNGTFLNEQSPQLSLQNTKPLSQFSWFFNGSQVATGSVYETGPLTLASHGEYTCVAFNNITCRNSTVSQTLTVVGESVTAA